MKDDRKTVPVPEGLSHGEKVNWLLSLEPDGDEADLAEWREFGRWEVGLRYGPLEIRLTKPTGFMIKIPECAFELPVKNAEELVRYVDALMVGRPDPMASNDSRHPDIPG